MKTWRVTINGFIPLTIRGDRGFIMDMLYDNGAMGVTIIEEKQQ